MADNISVSDSAGVARTVRTSDRGGVHFPWRIADVAISYVDKSGTTTAANTAQIAVPLNLVRRALYLENRHATEDLWFSLTGTAVIGANASIRLGPGDVWQEAGGAVSIQAVSVISATSGHPWCAMEGS